MVEAKTKTTEHLSSPVCPRLDLSPSLPPSLPPDLQAQGAEGRGGGCAAGRLCWGCDSSSTSWVLQGFSHTLCLTDQQHFALY